MSNFTSLKVDAHTYIAEDCIYWKEARPEADLVCSSVFVWEAWYLILGARDRVIWREELELYSRLGTVLSNKSMWDHSYELCRRQQLR